MADKDLWISLQNLNLGLERSPLNLSIEANRKRDDAHRLSLVVKGLHSSQNPAGIKIMMPKVWKLEGRITSRINEDGTVQFFFTQEHQMLTVLDKGPWTYKDWLVVVDRWTRRTYPDYLRIIPFWIKVLNIPDDSKEDRSIREIGGALGHVEDIHIKHPTADLAGEVWIRVPIDISTRLIFARYFRLPDCDAPVLIRFIYDKLRKFCSACGSLTHLAVSCTFQPQGNEQLQLPAPSQGLNQDQPASNLHQMEARPHSSNEAADETMGETVGSNINMETSENQAHNGSQAEFMDTLPPGDMQDGINATFVIREIGSASVQVQDRGIKRKGENDNDDGEVSTTRRKTQGQFSTTKAKGELGKDLQFAHHFLVSPDGTSGGLAIFWRDTVKCEFLDTPTLNCTDMYITEDSSTFCLTYVYGNPRRKLRQQMWHRMQSMVQAGLYQSKPRVVLGDFNEIKNNEEKSGGAYRPDWQFDNFQRMLNISGLHEVRTFGGFFTWIGNRSCGTIKSKLDRVVATTDWHELYPKAMVQLLDWCGSDHRPLLLQTEERKWRGKKLFRYDNRWRHDTEVHQVVQNIWKSECSHLLPHQFNEALKRCRNGLSQWKSKNNYNSQRKIQQLQMALNKAYESPSPDYNYISDLKIKLQHEYHLEEEYWRTRSHIQWLQLGDKNTRYFHEKTKQRRSHNRITSLEDNSGNILTEEKEIHELVHNYFEQIYSSAGAQRVDYVLQHIQPRVTPEINSSLTAPVTEEEIFQALSHMNVDKTPGPDGFTVGFYQYHWEAIKSEQWCQWIMKCVSSVTYSVLVNGSPTKKIYPQRGLRQGDPISPYLYLLCTEGLSSLLQAAMHTKSIKGFKASRGGPSISHMFFADDSLLFCQAAEEQCRHLLQILQDYAEASGQYVNFQKSAILFGKTVSPEIQQNIIRLTGISKIGGFGRYLGLPEAIGRNKYNAFSYIVQRVKNKLESWYSKFLTQAGKEVLIKSVATALPTYSMSCFLLPKKLVNQLSAQIRRYWWSSSKEKGKIPWIAWNQMTKLKQHGGMGFRDLHKFNIALLAKQSWRILKEPDSLLSRVIKAKYYSRATLMEANLGHRPSHAWRSIFQGTQLLKQGLQWRVGDGRTINVWSDQWLDNPPRPARPAGNASQGSLRVSDLMFSGGNGWDDRKLYHLIHPEDVKLIMKIRPSIVQSPDAPTWIFTKDGQYSVKSGYHQLTKSPPSDSNNSHQINQLCKSIWALSVPPKIKHFWWRLIHNALPVAEALAHRNLRISQDCLFCGETKESVAHIFFCCRVAREIWELSPINIDTDQFTDNHSLLDYIQAILSSASHQESTNHIFPFIGWRIWKARNDLLFNNKRWAIPHIIHQALTDLRIWTESQKALLSPKMQTSQKKKPAPTTFQEVLTHTPSLCCCTDASWENQESKAGIGWTLHESNGRYLLKGSSSIEPTHSALEAEAIALREALLHLKRLNYHNVIFCGDSQSLYGYLEGDARKQSCAGGSKEIQTYIQDIKKLAHGSYKFKFIRRTANLLADSLARKARINESPCVISWVP
ncbi:Endonuclease/exonuclease/phosphatase superfamily [Arabidopsis suecica]|uniref:Endonuclease/exonuclease/phosphatase superfamily n=1 Tax=Arabidopsis suecica TaxID=45249 RepID=A0A8T1ZU00_ARASU|nr:Endonuclease/exonuclease/phosphatase superfamily [Arabidopsis suecica]